ncbi:HEAT repeat domain-containing protein [Streptomyces sp. NBC_01264]|uniref:HEAT repeat domain-containing protein n=1 Tax=Streptomyces sp. NBC_01264 TaxID=2903804 RepID=UPI0022552908|nr:HEAT repeat domain-containing protein [Streptomyces sp. NBC_01264]MCX4778985.1 HEAT repeat domain-containing protein [Streptomyces sp. NBC_01264]
MNAEEIAVLIARAGHRDPDLRAEVASELAAGALSGRADDPLLPALIRLTSAPEAQVREQATFALGQLAEVDDRDIRAALWLRVGDEDPETREEAVRGLAVRRDPGAVPLLAALLEEPTAYVQTFNAAAVLGDPGLLPSLRKYEPADPGVGEALAACDPAVRERRDAAAWALLDAVYALLPSVDAALSTSRFEPDPTLTLVTAQGRAVTWNARTLLVRADWDPRRAAVLVAEAL